MVTLLAALCAHRPREIRSLGGQRKSAQRLFLEESTIRVEAAILSLESPTDVVSVVCPPVQLADVMCQGDAAPVRCRDPTRSTPFQRALKGLGCSREIFTKRSSQMLTLLGNMNEQSQTHKGSGGKPLD